MSPRVIHTAQALVDEVVEVPALPDRGGNVMAGAHYLYAGGAVNILIAAARSGAHCVLAGAHGTGPNGDLVRAALAGDGIAWSDDPIADQDTGNLGANAIVGGSAGIATGAALSIKMRKSDQVAVCFFGDGALGQGLFYEVANMAALWKLPVIYVVEHNLYGEYTHYTETMAGDVLTRAQGFGLHAVEVDGQDVRAVMDVTTDLVARARRGEGPSLLLCHTYRYHGHHVGDINRAYYRSPQEEAEWKSQRDPLNTLEDWLVSENGVEKKLIDDLQATVTADVEAAVHFALNAPYPSPEEVTNHVFA